MTHVLGIINRSWYMRHHANLRNRRSQKQYMPHDSVILIADAPDHVPMIEKSTWHRSASAVVSLCFVISLFPMFPLAFHEAIMSSTYTITLSIQLVLN